MARRDYIDIDKEEVPVIFDIDLANESFTMGINYNQTFDFFTVDLWDTKGKVIVLGEKMVLGIPLFEDIIDERIPGPQLVALDESGKETRISYENFGKTVFLYLDDVSDSDEPEFDDKDNSLAGDAVYG
ncbi:phage baseplate plug protein [Metabacillus fastidiosus]|uniref:phage baseplate plug family protein n=1 Tax=Metabacillus fastidiosus TaxID=1458 RepID=UPI002E2455AB|nr:hypothetical protein [Metabacillus fastidiosus]